MTFFSGVVWEMSFLVGIHLARALPTTSIGRRPQAGLGLGCETDELW